MGLKEKLDHVYTGDLEKVDAPELGAGESITIRPMLGSAMQRITRENALQEQGKPHHLLGTFAAAVICDETGKFEFTERDAEMLEEKMPIPLLMRIVNAANHICGFDEVAGKN